MATIGASSSSFAQRSVFSRSSELGRTGRKGTGNLRCRASSGGLERIPRQFREESLKEGCEFFFLLLFSRYVDFMKITEVS